MAKSNFKEGIVGGVPEGVRVANKFGEVAAINPANNNVEKVELHDCGIVYREKDPYSICIMTEGTNFDDLSKVIGDISKIIWAHTE